MDSLVVHDSRGERTVELTEDVYVMGRSSENAVQIRDQMASRRHCQVERDGSGWKVVDLESSNGTCVNGKTINRHVLSVGDEIRVGDVRIVFAASVGGKEGSRKDEKKEKKEKTKKTESRSKTSRSSGSRRSTTRRRRAGSESDDERNRTTRRGRAVRRSSSSPVPMIVGLSVGAVVVIGLVLSSSGGGSQPTVDPNEGLLDDAQVAYASGDYGLAQDYLDRIRRPRPKIVQQRDRLQSLISAGRLDEKAGREFVRILNMSEDGAEAQEAKLRALQSFHTAFEDSSKAKEALSEVDRLSALKDLNEVPRADPMVDARKRSNDLAERYRFGAAREIWERFRIEHPLSAEEADREREKVGVAAQKAYDDLLERARKLKEEGDLEEASRTIDRIINNFGIDRLVQQARRVRDEEMR